MRQKIIYLTTIFSIAFISCEKIIPNELKRNGIESAEVLAFNNGLNFKETSQINDSFLKVNSVEELQSKIKEFKQSIEHPRFALLKSVKEISSNGYKILDIDDGPLPKSQTGLVILSPFYNIYGIKLNIANGINGIQLSSSAYGFTLAWN